MITKKIKGTAMRYEGTSKASLPRYKIKEERDAFPIWRKIGVFVLGSQLPQDRQDSPKAHCVHEHLSHCPLSWQNENITLVPLTADLVLSQQQVMDTATHPCRTICETASSNALAPFTIWKLEFSLFPFFFCPQGCYVGKTS